MAAVAQQSPDVATYFIRWFGTNDTSDDQPTGRRGALRFYDAPVKLQYNSYLHDVTRTSIEPVTGAAKQNHLSTHRLVDAYRPFEVFLALDVFDIQKPITTQEYQALLTLLQTLSHLQLGKGKSVGQGCIEWKLTHVDSWSLQNLGKWLTRNLQETKDGFTDYIPLSNQAVSIPLSNKKSETLFPVWLKETFQLHPIANSPLLINDPYAEDVKNQAGDDGFDHAFLRDKHLAIIPASTLKGWFRAQCRRILLTLCHQNVGALEKSHYQHIDQLLGEIFGSTTAGQSLIRFYDASLRFNEDDCHEQIFNAVDRFTGGVKDSALYNVKALRTEKPFQAEVTYHPALKEKGWANLLLFFVWRDAEEGDLVLGWGKSKGYGRLLLKDQKGGWKAWLDKHPASQWQQWETELQQKLQLDEVKV